MVKVIWQKLSLLGVYKRNLLSYLPGCSTRREVGPGWCI